MAAQAPSAPAPPSPQPHPQLEAPLVNERPLSHPVVLSWLFPSLLGKGSRRWGRKEHSSRGEKEGRQALVTYYQNAGASRRERIVRQPKRLTRTTPRLANA